MHGRGWGAALLGDAVRVALDGIRTAGGRLIVVDAISSEAAGFYAHMGFSPLPGNAARLVMKASDGARSLGVRWP
ncbi:MAG: GNAT family N-acetyltransferase [Actinobacteria bacterium]|nr:GNAT family N-acetyltransferase [Actinomycetota bacterium]